MTTQVKRIAVNFGGGFIPGLNSVIIGVVSAAAEQGIEVLGIRDGFDGLLFPERYKDGGLVSLTPQFAENLGAAAFCVLGTAASCDPFHVRVETDETVVEEDRSDALLDMLRKERIDAVVSVVEARALGILWRLSRKGLRIVAVPKSVENDVANTALSFGFNSALSFTADMLERIRQAAISARRIGVVEVPGRHAGWLALQAGIAAMADTVLIPEIPFDLSKVALRLNDKLSAGKTFALAVVAEGAAAAEGAGPLENSGLSSSGADEKMKASLSPGAAEKSSSHAIERTGLLAKEVAVEIQRRSGVETHSFVLGQLCKGGTPTVVDRQLALGYGASALRALLENRDGVMVVFDPPDIKFLPIGEAVNKYRTVPLNGEFIQIARTLGIHLGD